MVPTTATVIPMPGLSPAPVPRVRQAVRNALRSAGCDTGGWWRTRMHTELLRFVPARSRDAEANLLDHYVVCRQDWRAIAKSITPEMAKAYDNHEDCVLLRQHCSLPPASDGPTVTTTLRRTLGQWADKVDLTPACKAQFLSALAYEVEPLFAPEPAQLRATLVQELRDPARELHTATLPSVLRDADVDVMCVLVDRDLARRCAASPTGYCYRLVSAFTRNVDAYEAVPSITRDEACRARTVIAAKILGARFGRKRLELPIAYGPSALMTQESGRARRHTSTYGSLSRHRGIACHGTYDWWHGPFLPSHEQPGCTQLPSDG